MKKIIIISIIACCILIQKNIAYATDNVLDKYCDFSKVEELSRECQAIYERESAACPRGTFCNHSEYFRCHNELVTASAYYMTECVRNNKFEKADNVSQDILEETEEVEDASPSNISDVPRVPSGKWTNPFNFWINPFSYIGAWLGHSWNSLLVSFGLNKNQNYSKNQGSQSYNDTYYEKSSNNRKVIVSDEGISSSPATVDSDPTTQDVSSISSQTTTTTENQSGASDQSWAASHEAVAQNQGVSTTPSLGTTPSSTPSVVTTSYSCVGPTPRNSELCPGDDEGVIYYQEKHLVDVCSIPRGSEPKCEYVCKTEHLDDGTCREYGIFRRFFGFLYNLFWGRWR